MSAFKQYTLYNIILNNKASSAELEAQLVDDSWGNALTDLLKKRHVALDFTASSGILNMLIQSPKAMAAVFQSNYMLDRIFRDKVLTYNILSNPAAMAGLKSNASAVSSANSFINSPIHKIRRTIFTANGTFTLPVEGIYQMSVVTVGGGASSRGRTTNIDGAEGGAGGQCRIVAFPSSGIPTGNITVSIGAGGAGDTDDYVNGGQTTFGSLCTALGGNGKAGGGDNEGQGVLALTDGNLTQALWQIYSTAIKGGEGGGGGVYNGWDGNELGKQGGYAGILGAGGAGGLIDGGAGTGGRAGTGFCNGGGGGAIAYNNQISQSAAANTGCGGGGPNSEYAAVSATNGNGSGGSGIVVVYYIVN